MKAIRTFFVGLGLIAAATLAGNVIAQAIQPQTTGTEMRFQSQAVKLGMVEMVNPTGTAVAGAVTINQNSGVVTSEALTTAAGAVYTLTITDSSIAAADIVLVSMGNGTNSAGSPAITTITPAAGSVVIKVQNIHASAALNGTLTFGFVIVKTSPLNAQ